MLQGSPEGSHPRPNIGNAVKMCSHETLFPPRLETDKSTENVEEILGVEYRTFYERDFCFCVTHTCFFFYCFCHLQELFLFCSSLNHRFLMKRVKLGKVRKMRWLISVTIRITRFHDVVNAARGKNAEVQK